MFFGLTRQRFDALDAAVQVFLSLAHGFHNAVPIVRASQQDKEYHFQNWVRRRIQATGLALSELGRHGYPDFVLDGHACGFEVKGLAHPGRHTDFDCNSQLPLAEHDGRKIYYIFGRYPNTTDHEYLVHDLVMCSASLLNAEVANNNTNQSFRGAGSYGDILIRDRRMYVCKTPYSLTSGTAGHATLILEEQQGGLDLAVEQVGRFQRVEAQSVVTGYAFDLTANALTSRSGPNAHAGRPHSFFAYKISGHAETAVALNP